MLLMQIVGLGLLATAVSWLATRQLVGALTRHAILDRPNARSSHVRPTPRGGGIAVIGVVLPAWALIAALSSERPATTAVVLAGALGLALLSWGDDRAGLPVALRLAAQAITVVVVLSMAPARWDFSGGALPPSADLAVVALAWIWFINLFNFMDGIDGIAGGEAASIGVGIAIVAATAGLDWPIMAKSIALAGAAAGFLAWNWHPARIFLGDVGSVPLGYLIGWLLLELAQAGQWAAALILPLYFLADATITLFRRALNRERIWQAHRSHFYQRAVRAGLSHADVSGRVLVANAFLVAAAVAAAVAASWLGLLLGLLVVLLLLGNLAWRRR
ncbi:MAG: glycosyltransferase family 4 protein [Alphaproteobacteria bacterium]|nr:glycosyltransferase family 4 protein [Alphaproteobacteria bacterium]